MKKAKIKTDPRNVRIHTDRSSDAIRESLANLGAGRSIVLDAENVIIGGNGVYQEAQNLGLPVRVIESDGKELIAIRRTDLQTNDEKRKALALADNRLSDLSFFDEERMLELLQECDSLAISSGFTEDEIRSISESLTGALSDLEENSFATNIKSMSDVFSITFVFSKEKGDCVTEYIRLNDKGSLTEHIIEFCKKAVK